MTTKLNLNIPEKLEPFLTKKKRYKIAYGGRGAAKSMTVAGMLSHKTSVEGVLTGCIREFQNSLEDSVYALIKEMIGKIGIPGYRILNNRIDHRFGGGLRFKGLSRSIEAIKSSFGYKYFWLEEGQFISENSLRILTPTLREEDSELWITANPLSSADPFSERFILPYLRDLDTYGFYEDDLHYIVKMNYYDNPWFPEVLELERQQDYRILSRAMYDHIWLGEFNDSVEDSIILTEWFDAAINAHEKLGFKPEGAIVAAHDPSDLGKDAKGIAIRQGSVILHADERSFGDVNEGCDWGLSVANDYNADLFVWDGGGLGVTLRRQIHNALKGKKRDYRLFLGNESPERPNSLYNPIGDADRKYKDRTNKELFANLRAQKYWDLRDRLFSTYLAVEKNMYIDPEKLISFSPDIPNLKLMRSEICRIPRKYVASGKIQIMDKKEMQKLKIQSPNVSDSVMMSLITPDLINTSQEPIQFTTVYT